MHEQSNRSELWNIWNEAFWTAIEDQLGQASGRGASRLYHGVWVMTSFLDDTGLIYFGTCRAPRTAGKIMGYGFCLRWDQSESSDVSSSVLALVERVRADPLFGL